VTPVAGYLKHEPGSSSVFLLFRLREEEEEEEEEEFERLFPEWEEEEEKIPLFIRKSTEGTVVFSTALLLFSKGEEETVCVIRGEIGFSRKSHILSYFCC
jgi:hypothetical protein